MSEKLYIHDSHIEFTDEQKACEALHRLAKRYKARNRKLKYIDMDLMETSPYLYSTLIVCRYEWHNDCLDLLGEGFGDEDILFRTLAPYVVDGSFLECYTASKGTWRYIFDGGKLFIVKASFIKNEPYRTLRVPFGANDLRVITPLDPNYPSELGIDIVSKDGLLVRDVLTVAPTYGNEADEADFSSINVKLYVHGLEDWDKEIIINVEEKCE